MPQVYHAMHRLTTRYGTPPCSTPQRPIGLLRRAGRAERAGDESIHLSGFEMCCFSHESTQKRELNSEGTRTRKVFTTDDEDGHGWGEGVLAAKDSKNAGPLPG